jgi:hypothetical protein
MRNDPDSKSLRDRHTPETCEAAACQWLLMDFLAHEAGWPRPPQSLAVREGLKLMADPLTR